MNFIRLTKATLPLSAILWSGAIAAQGITGVKLEIRTNDNVSYNVDGTPLAGFATVQERTAATGASRNFGRWFTIADVIAINETPARGVHVMRGSDIKLSTNSSNAPNGRAIADVNRQTLDMGEVEILQADGTAVGTLMLQGSYGGPVPPGVPASFGAGNYAIVGGTGAYLGARGFCAWFRASNTPFVAGNSSVAEDPLKRRELRGDDYLVRCKLIPMVVPEIVALLHDDFSPVTPAKPARPGEVLVISARGLGPTTPGVEPAATFPESPLQPVNSPIQVSVGGLAAEVINKVGWPGQDNLYRLDIRLPRVEGFRSAVVQITAAWIPGPAVTIPVQ